MFTKTAIFVFTFIGLFAVLFAGIENQFWTNQTSFSSSVGSDKEIRDRLDTANVTVYSSTGNGNMTYQWSSYHDHPSGKQHQAGLPSGQYLEIWWSEDQFFIPGIGTTYRKALEFRHTTEVWWGLAHVKMEIYYEDNSLIGQYIFSDQLTNAWRTSANASVFYTRTPVVASYLIEYNQSAYSSIVDAWENDELSYTLSYELNENATKLSMFGLIGGLLSFDAPSLGLPSGFFGTAITLMIAGPFYVITAILITKVIFAIIPFIRGIEE